MCSINSKYIYPRLTNWELTTRALIIENTQSFCIIISCCGCKVNNTALLCNIIRTSQNRSRFVNNLNFEIAINNLSKLINRSYSYGRLTNRKFTTGGLAVFDIQERCTMMCSNRSEVHHWILRSNISWACKAWILWVCQYLNIKWALKIEPWTNGCNFHRSISKIEEWFRLMRVF